MKKRKKAQMSMEWVIGLIILGALLIFVFLFMSGAFGSSSDFFSNLFGGPKVNVANVIDGCQKACSLAGASGYEEYCVRQRDIVFDAKSKKEKISCSQLEKRANSGLEHCTNYDCQTALVSCQGLMSGECYGIAKCEVNWMDQNAFTAAKTDSGPGKTNQDVIDVTAKVTDPNDKSGKSGQFCVKTIKN